jgi:replicative DNA helicase
MSKIEYNTAEETVIGCLLLDSSLIEEVSDILKPHDFLTNFYAQVYEVMLEMKRKNEYPIDIITVAQKFIDPGFTEGQAIARLAGIAQLVFAPKNAKEYAKIVKQNSNDRKLRQLFIEGQKKIKNGEINVSDYVKKGIDQIENNIPVEIQPYSTLLASTFSQIDQAFNKKTDLVGVPSGLISLDKRLSGFQPGELIILAARPRIGKTALALNMADHMGIIKKLPVIFFSLEMTASQLIKRTISRLAQVDGRHVIDGNLTPEEWQKIQVISPYLHESKLFINDKCGLSVQDMRAYCRKVRNIHGLSAIFIDYLGLIGNEGINENETMRLTKISAELKMLAKDFEIPVIALAQLNRELEKRPDKHPILSDLRGSGSIEQDADIVLFLHREENQTTADLDIAKFRNGESGIITLHYRGAYCEFKDI